MAMDTPEASATASNDNTVGVAHTAATNAPPTKT
jgi:hypothetical protein